MGRRTDDTSSSGRLKRTDASKTLQATVAKTDRPTDAAASGGRLKTRCMSTLMRKQAVIAQTDRHTEDTASGGR